MLITIAELELHRIAVSKTYDAGAFDYHGASFRQLKPLEVEAVAQLEGQEVRIKGHLKTRLGAACDRCLGPVEIPVERDFDLFYRPVGTIAREEEVEVREEELSVGFFSGEGVSLEDLLTEQVILSVPMKVVCRAECKGLCPVCGADLNVEKCGCPAPKKDSPFASLLG